MLHMSDLLQNFACVLVFIMIANRVYPYIHSWKKPSKQISVGLLFGIAGLLTMLLSIQNSDFTPGVNIDLKAVISGMSGILGGPISAVVTVAVIGAYRLYIGGLGMTPGIVGISAVALAGTAIHVMLRNKDIPFRKIWWAPVLFGLLTAGIQLLTTTMFPADVRDDLLKEYTLPFILVFPLATIMFHYFMTVEWVRYHDTVFDRVTRLPTFERMKGSWQRRINRRQPFSLVIWSVDRLQSVIDMHGVRSGGTLLGMVSERLTRHLPEDGAASKLNSHDFAVMLPSFDMLQSLIWIVDVKKKLSEPYFIDGAPVHITFSTGLAVYEGGETSVDELIRNADTALRHAKETGPNQSVSYETRLTEQIRYRMSLEKDLRFAMERGQLEMHYQPQYELETGRLRGFEALIRWRHPDWGPISPAEFIPLAEETGLIVPIGQWVLETSCRMAVKLSGISEGATMAVNVSAVQLTEPDFPIQVARILRETGLPPNSLELELTESTMVRSFDTASEQLLRLKKLGIRLALDDFGVGYSSLSYLRRLPFDIIKIDRSFIEDIGRSRDDRMTKSIIDWVRELRYGIVAEGLESYDQLYWLKQWKCDIAQGYLFSRPMAEDDLLTYLRQLLPYPLTGLAASSKGIPS